MLLLMLFAVVAGAGTAITPCVLPVAPGAAVRQRDRRPSAAARDRGRARDHVHDRDRRARPARQGRRPRQRRRADAGGHRADRVRDRAADPGVWPSGSRRRCRGWRGSAPRRAATASGPGSRVGGALGLRLRAVRRPDPRRRDLGQRLDRRLGPDRRSSRSPIRSGLAAVMLLYAVRRPRGARPDQAPRPRTRRRAHARSGAAAHRRGRWPPTSTSASRRRSPRTRACRPFLVDPDAVARELERRPEPARLAATRLAVRRAPEGGGQGDSGRRSARRGDPRRQDPVAAGARPRAQLHRQPGLVQHSGRPAADDGRAARPRRARRLLDLHLHQLHPHAAVRQGPVRDLSPLRTRGGRRRDARVHVRAGGEQRRAGDPHRRDPLPGRPGQPLRDLERLPEPVLAGRVLHRRQRQGPPHPVRRGQLQAGRGGGPRAAVRGRRPAPATADDRDRDDALDPSSARPRPTSIRSVLRGSPSHSTPASTPTPASAASTSTSGP